MRCTYIFSVSCGFLALQKEKKEIIERLYWEFYSWFGFNVIWQATKIGQRVWIENRVWSYALQENKAIQIIHWSVSCRHSRLFDTLIHVHYLCNLFDCTIKNSDIISGSYYFRFLITTVLDRSTLVRLFYPKNIKHNNHILSILIIVQLTEPTE